MNTYTRRRYNQRRFFNRRRTLNNEQDLVFLLLSLERTSNHIAFINNRGGRS